MSENYPWITWESSSENYQWELSTENYHLVYHQSRRKVEIYRDTGVSKKSPSVITDFDTDLLRDFKNLEK